MKRVIIIHGWSGYPNKGWRPWLKKELELQGFTAIIPAMPNTDHPKCEQWVQKLNKVIGKVDKDTYLVGHSLGCITILRYLEQNDVKIGGAVLVSGFALNLTYDGYKGELSSFFDTPIAWETIRSRCPKFWIISSDNDPFVPKENHSLLVENLGASGWWEHNLGHMGDSITKLPSALHSIEYMVAGKTPNTC